MPDILFLLQKDRNGWPVSLAAPFPESCDEANWLANEEKVGCTLALSGQTAKTIVPVGSIEFVNQYLSQMGLGPMEAMNIPPELEQEQFLGRRIFRDVSKTELSRLRAEFGPLLLKPGRHPKRFEAIPHEERLLGEIPDNELLFVSQMIQSQFASEWRVFVSRGRVMDIRPYFMEHWLAPDAAVVHDMADTLREHPALALDVAVLLEGGRTVAIECHPFIACGLYGFEGPKMVSMARDAWLGELRRQKSHLLGHK